ncbi:LysR family transcriptional regulator [Coralliovum pocilloporae]|uniref:LysR family transcriptional regulator n=1 Tax=Coralliovum pocilloporae TaxID=3066369 RepID=UPI003306ECEC
MSGLRRNLPSIRALEVFDCVARVQNATRAAEELSTSQSAVSRHIRQLEIQLGAALFARHGRGIILTPVGEVYAREVADILQRLHEAGQSVASGRHELTIACTHEVSHLLLMPRYNALKEAVGSGTHIRILTCEYTAIPGMIDEGADIVFDYLPKRPRGHAAMVLREEVTPVAAPDFLAGIKDILAEPPDRWGGIPLLSLTKDNTGWATWRDWFSFQGVTPPPTAKQAFSNYVYALEAATRGEGLVLAWRGFADRYLESGQLVPVRETWLKRENRLYAVMTRNGDLKDVARNCLRALSGFGSSVGHRLK